MIDLQIDCPNKRITLVAKIWCGSRIAQNARQQIRQAVARFWNPSPRLKYRNCDVYVEVRFSTEHDRPAEYDQWMGTGVVDPRGGGNTGQSGDNSPRKVHITSLSPLPGGNYKPETISHELGHCMGLDDELRGGRKWDRNGITSDHIEEIIRKGAAATQGAWLVDTRCCRGAVANAVIERVTDDEEIDWAHDESEDSGKKKTKKKAKKKSKKKTSKHIPGKMKKSSGRQKAAGRKSRIRKTGR